VIFKLENFIASQTNLARRKILELLNQKKILINGKIATSLSQEIDSKRDKIKVEETLISYQFPFVYYLFNKPKGVICTLNDPKGRQDLTSFLKKIKAPVFSVGRLDRQTSGLLLLTNDGAFAHTILHPKFSLNKTYVIALDKPISKTDLKRLEVGMILEDGPIQYSNIGLRDIRHIELSVNQGRNRIVRRTFEFLGYEIKALRRVAIGNVTLNGLKEGEIKSLSLRELQQLKKNMNKDFS
jgi:23S rRNA pseudouridine2605 synthase